MNYRMIEFFNYYYILFNCSEKATDGYYISFAPYHKVSQFICTLQNNSKKITKYRIAREDTKTENLWIYFSLVNRRNLA